MKLSEVIDKGYNIVTNAENINTVIIECCNMNKSCPCYLLNNMPILEVAYNYNILSHQRCQINAARIIDIDLNYTFRYPVNYDNLIINSSNFLITIDNNTGGVNV